jgi:hypothetical protein
MISCIRLIQYGLSSASWIASSLPDLHHSVIEERDNSDVLLATCTYGQGMDAPLAMEVISGAITVTYYHRDAPSMNSGQGWAVSPRSQTRAARSSSGTSTTPSVAGSPA